MEENNQKDKVEKLTKINPILQKLTGKNTYLLWENEEEKKIVLEYIYNYCENNIYDRVKIYELSVWSGLSYAQIDGYAKKYALEYLGYSLEKYTQRKITYGLRRRQHKNSEKKEIYYPRIFDNILNAKTLEEIVQIASVPGIKLSTLRRFDDYIRRHHNGDEKVKEKLKLKIKMYTDYISEKNRIELENKKNNKIHQVLSTAIETITKFINDTDCNTIEYFCYKYGLNKKTFEEYVTIIREYQIDLYNIYDKKINDIRSQRYAIIINQVKYIIEKIKHGIEENGINRPFDLLDYYQITSIPLEDILKIAKDIFTTNEFNIIKRFITQNISGVKHTPNVIYQIMSEKVIIKYEKDSKGNPIPGTEELFSSEEKEKLINYLKEKNIPINLKTYNILYRRYRSGTIEIEERSKSK